jgi:hypothetical protein
MKSKIIILSLIAPILSGCVATSYQKSISVTRDANGKIISTTETESVMQPAGGGVASSPAMKFQYLKNWWGSGTIQNDPPSVNGNPNP